jgi:hypothetical protein
MHLHYVTAREMVDIVRAAEQGANANPRAYRDSWLPPPDRRRRIIGAAPRLAKIACGWTSSLSATWDVEAIAAGNSVRELPRLRRFYGKGRWRKMKGVARIRLRDGRLRPAELHWYEAHGIGTKKSSSARSTSTKSPKSAANSRQFAVCVDNSGYEASLERNKIYVVLPDKDAESDGDVRVVDESGEDYLFSADRFVAIDVPAPVKASLVKS